MLNRIFRRTYLSGLPDLTSGLKVLEFGASCAAPTNSLSWIGSMTGRFASGLSAHSQQVIGGSTGISFGLAASKEADLYNVRVVTGRRRGAETSDSVSIQLIGANCTTPPIPLPTSDGFERGSVKEFTIPAPKDLGTIKRIHIEKDQGDELSRGGGWYLRQVEVDSPDGEHQIFPCNSWIGESDCGSIKAPLERNLLPSANEMMPAYHEPVNIFASGMAIPHPDKVKQSGAKGMNQKGFGNAGEDAYFYASGRNNVFGMGVADGVYSWREQGIDSGHLAQALMSTARNMVRAGIEDVFKVFSTSARYVQSEGMQGSCTVCMLIVNQANGQLHAANLGDAGFMVFGRSRSLHSFQAQNLDLELKFKSGQLEHEFGRPYQLGHHANSSRVECADLVSFYVSPGDVIVMGSDGLLDNLSEHEIMLALNQLQAEGSGPSAMVQTLLKMAFESSLDKKKVTPYSQGASDAFNMVYNGGKPDDISIVVAQCK